MSDTQIDATTANLADHRFMAMACELAMRIPRRPWPNPPVGAVIVRDDEVVAMGAHHGAGEPHAEQVALAAAGDLARGATLYSTLEPCNHQGRTPPCSEAIIAAGVAKVVYGVAEHGLVARGGAARLQEAGLDVSAGALADVCLDLVWPFVCSEGFARPFVELKTATTLDGRFGIRGQRDQAPVYFTGDLARCDVHRRRCWMDLVLVGRETARTDRPRLDTRLADAPGDGPRELPAAGVVSTGGGEDAVLRRDDWLVFHGPDQDVVLAPGAMGIACPLDGLGRVDPAAVVDACQARGIHTVMVEGGPTLAAAFLAAGCVDRWVQYVAPKLVGTGATWPDWAPETADEFSLTACARVGGDVRLIWDRRDFASTLRDSGSDTEVD